MSIGSVGGIIQKALNVVQRIRFVDVDLLGERVSPEHAKERKEICMSCDNRKDDADMPYCGCCFCPIEVKVNFKTHLLSAINPLNTDLAKRTTVKCCHANGDKWAAIEKKYQEPLV